MSSAAYPRTRFVKDGSHGSDENLFFLDDEQWEAISVHLPVRQRGPKRLDDRIVISGILHVLQSGCAWRDCPREYGPYMTVFNRYLRWKKRGIWQAIFEELLYNDRLPKLSLRPRPLQGNAEKLQARTDENVAALARAAREFAPAGRVLAPGAHAGDFERAERMLAVAELAVIFKTYEDKARENWIEPVVDWHLRRAALTHSALMAAAGTANAHDVEVGKLGYPLRRLADLFTSDYVDNKTRLILALESLNFYASGGIDNGAKARKVLDMLVPTSLGKDQLALDG